jgi:hypothetical protein
VQQESVAVGQDTQESIVDFKRQAQRRPRLAIVETVGRYEQRAAEESQRAFSAEAGVPRTTLQYWVTRKEQIEANAELVTFFESSAGVAFLQRLVLALHFVFSFLGPCGVRLVSQFLELTGLSSFVASSVGSQYKVATAVEKGIVEFGEEQQKQMGAAMAPRKISICEDETFHPQICLVAIEPVSDYILLEEYATKRNAASWNERLGIATANLPVTIVQSTSDEGTGLLSHVHDGLGAHHSPDLFHVQYEITRTVSGPLASQVRRTQAQVEKAAATERQRRDDMQSWNAKSHGPGRPPNFAARVAHAEAEHKLAIQAHEAAVMQQQLSREAVKGLGTTYHPVNINNGKPQSSQEVKAQLQKHFATLHDVAAAANLPERSVKGIAKAEKLIPAMEATMAFYQSEVDSRIRALRLSPKLQRHVMEKVLPAAYLEIAAKKAGTAESRHKIADIARLLTEQAKGLQPTLLLPTQVAAITDVIRDCAHLFQRASSCVEGRNGQLALRHHCLHTISPQRLRALTTVHNFAVEDDKHKTAAERFFGAKPANLFEHLVRSLQPLARPAKKRPNITQPALVLMAAA